MNYKTILLAILLMGAWQGLFAQGCEEPAGDAEGDDANKPKLIGFIQPQFDYNFVKDGPDTYDENTFKFKRARIGVTGKIPYDFAYYVMVENSAFVSSTGNPYLLDAFISYRRFKWANVSFGSFKQPFGLEINTSCSGLHTIERSEVSNQLVSPMRDMGVMILGGTNETLVKYAVAFMNGSGLGKVDNNIKKDVSGRITFKPIDFVRFGGSFRYGWPTNSNADSIDRFSLAGELEVNWNNFMLQAEYIWDKGAYNLASGGGCGGDPMLLGEKRGGYYIMAKYKTYFMFEPVVKYEFFDVGNDSGDKSGILTLGANYFFNDKVRLQANYRYRAETNDAKDAEVPNDAFLLQLQVKF